MVLAITTRPWHETRISTEASRIAIHVIPMNEELYIARAALRLV